MTTQQEKNNFYRDRYTSILISVLIAIILTLVGISVVLYQVYTRPLPIFIAVSTNNQRMQLTAHDNPNLLSTTILKWASKAAVAAYTFNFAEYNDQINAVKPYFTDAGWSDYQASVSGLISAILAQKLLVYGVVSGTPVISNQGELPGIAYAWRVQIPFIVIYQGADVSKQYNYTVLMTIVKVSTLQNPNGIAVDQFVMVAS